MCIRSCLVDSLSIPENKSPVFTAAMRDVVVTASQVSPAIKVNSSPTVIFIDTFLKTSCTIDKIYRVFQKIPVFLKNATGKPFNMNSTVKMAM